MITFVYFLSFAFVCSMTSLLILGGMLWVAELLCRVGRR